MNIHIMLINQSLRSHHDWISGQVGFDISYHFIRRVDMVENYP